MNALFFKALVMFGLMFGLTEGNVPPAETPVQQQVQTIFQAQAQRMLGIVDEVQAKLQVQEQTMLQAQGELPEPVGEAFKYMNGYLNRVKQDVEEGIVPLKFRASQPEPQADVTPGQYGPGPNDCEEDCVPVGDEHKYGQEEDNDGQNGPGENDGDCVPEGDENQYGQTDDDNGQNGDGDGDCDQDCEPIGDQNQNGKP
ncbi:MAG: hypothetical protein H6667_21570 [Ardenticatenaceae bacterium]|nr:hypothetical protein [Ardenticatenaceae bacterium]